jgi:hypothetical protein
MKTPAASALLAVVGLVCGVVVSLLNTAFYPRYCGEDCWNDQFGAMVLWTLATVAAFVLLGTLSWTKSNKSPRHLGLTLAALSALVLVPAAALYVVRLQGVNQQILKTKGVQVDIEYSHMVIATRGVPGLNITDGDRCAIGQIQCDHEPLVVEALCRGGVVTIPQPDWLAFKRLPAEDLPGLQPSDEVSRFPAACRSR